MLEHGNGIEAGTVGQKHEPTVEVKSQTARVCENNASDDIETCISPQEAGTEVAQNKDTQEICDEEASDDEASVGSIESGDGSEGLVCGLPLPGDCCHNCVNSNNKKPTTLTTMSSAGRVKWPTAVPLVFWPLTWMKSCLGPAIQSANTSFTWNASTIGLTPMVEST